MIVILAGKIEVDPDIRQQYIDVRIEQTTAYRTMPGTLHYSITADAVDPSIVNVFECYESEEALAAHGAVHTRNLDLPVRSYDMYRYEATRNRLDVG
jgi:quinol monooxygenase YgiN